MTDHDIRSNEQSLAYQLQDFHMEVSVLTAQLTSTIAGNEEVAQKIASGEDEYIKEWVRKTESRHKKDGENWIDLDDGLILDIAREIARNADCYKEYDS
jgi:hypothetical protein